MQTTQFPRVAIVSSNPVRGDQSNGILMRSLFEGWPRDRLTQIYFPVAVTNMPDPIVCGEYRLLHLSGRVQRLGGTLASPTTSPARESSPMVRNMVRAVTRHRQVSRWLRPCVEAWSSVSRLGATFERELRKLRPDGVYALLGNFYLTRIVVRACERLRIPLFVHVTDDFVTSLYQDVPFGAAFQAASDKWFRRAVAYSSGRAAISSVMADEFASRYGKPWNWFTTVIDADAYEPAPRAPDGPVRLVFAGNLGLERWRTLREIALALQALRAESGLDSRLEIYAANDQLRAFREALDVPPITELRGWAAPGDLPRTFREADVLVHVESFDPKMTAYTRLSFSTKLSQYMMAGRPILAVGPQQLGSLQMVRATGAGLAIHESDSSAMKLQLERFLPDGEAQLACGRRGRNWAVEWVDRSSAQVRFRNLLTQSFARADRTVSAQTPV
jgi:glycosyltransferase involved in cell wall biosynthesis